MSVEIPTKDGVRWSDDNLQSVALLAAMALNSLRTGRKFNDWHVYILMSWLMDVSRGEAPFDSFAVLFLARVFVACFPGRTPPKTTEDVRLFAGEAGEALGQSLWFDPSLNGWPRATVREFCLTISSSAGADSWYSRRSGNDWRNEVPRAS